MQDRIVGISEARAHLSALIDEADTEPIYVLKHGRPAGVVLSASKYDALLDRIEDLEDSLAVLSANPSESVPFQPGATRVSA